MLLYLLLIKFIVIQESELCEEAAGNFVTKKHKALLMKPDSCMAYGLSNELSHSYESALSKIDKGNQGKRLVVLW